MRMPSLPPAAAPSAAASAPRSRPDSAYTRGRRERRLITASAPSPGGCAPGVTPGDAAASLARGGASAMRPGEARCWWSQRQVAAPWGGGCAQSRWNTLDRSHRRSCQTLLSSWQLLQAAAQISGPAAAKALAAAARPLTRSLCVLLQAVRRHAQHHGPPAAALTQRPAEVLGRPEGGEGLDD